MTLTSQTASLGINGFDHRQFLNAFYTGRFPGSFARGLPFQENAETGDARISGTCASLAGLEKALKQETDVEVELAIKRILLIHGVILTAGGIPLIYLGDEIATRNDYRFRDDASKSSDSRWVHRPPADWDRVALRFDAETIEGRTYQGMQRLIKLRKETPAFAGSKLEVINTENEHVLGYVRSSADQRVLVFANFTEGEQAVSAHILGLYSVDSNFSDLLSGTAVPHGDLKLEPYGFVCLAGDARGL